MGDCGLTGRKIMLTPTAVPHRTVAAPSRARIRRRLTVGGAGRYVAKTSLPPASPDSVGCRYRTRSAYRVRYR